jgi:hypothetical protein
VLVEVDVRTAVLVVGLRTVFGVEGATDNISVLGDAVSVVVSALLPRNGAC